MKIRPIAPIGRSLHHVHRNYGYGDRRSGMYLEEMDDFPPPSEAAMKARELRRLRPLTDQRSTGDIARELGLPPSAVFDLCYGRAEPEDPADWETIYAAIRGDRPGRQT